MQGGEQLERGVLGEPVHHRGALPLTCGDEVAVVRHVADLGLGDGLDDGGCWGGHGCYGLSVDADGVRNQQIWWQRHGAKLHLRYLDAGWWMDCDDQIGADNWLRAT